MARSQVSVAASPAILGAYFDTAVSWTLAGTNASYVNTTAVKLQSSASLKLVCASSGAGQFAQIQQQFTSFAANRSGRWDFWVYVEDYTKLDATNGIQVLVGTTGLTKSFSAVYRPEYNGWHCIRLIDSLAGAFASGAVWAASGGADWAVDTFTTIRIRLYAATSATAVAYFDSCFYGGKERSKLLITVDDGDSSILNNSLTPSAPYTYLRNAGLKATHYIIGSRIGTAGYLTEANLATLYANGDDLAVHGDASLASLGSLQAIEDDIESNRNFLISRGYTRACDHYAYPNGIFELNSDGGAAIFSILQRIGIKTARTAARRGFSGMIPTLSRNNTLLIIGHSQTVDTTIVMRNNLTSLIKIGGVGITMFHQWIQSGSVQDIQCNMADWTSFVDHVKSDKQKGLLDVVSISELYSQTSSGRTQ